MWPEHQQKAALLKILQLAEQNCMPILDPVISRTKGRPIGSKNKQKPNSKRNPSAFEIKEEEISGEENVLRVKSLATPFQSQIVNCKRKPI